MVGITEKITDRGFPSNFELADYWLENNLFVSPAMDLWFRIVNPGPDIKFPGQWALQQFEQGRVVTNPPPEQRLMMQFAPGASEDFSAIGTRIENLVTDYASRLVFASSQDAFENILADLCAQIAAMGEQEVYEDAIARYEVSKQVAARIIAGN